MPLGGWSQEKRKHSGNNGNLKGERGNSSYPTPDYFFCLQESESLFREKPGAQETTFASANI